MTSANTMTGRHGKMVVEDNLIAKTTKWAVSNTLASKTEWGDSDSEGFTNRAAGRKDATFDCEGKFAKNQSQFNLFAPEDIAEVVLWLGLEEEAPEDNLYWAFPRALCMDFKLEVDIDGETVIGWNSSWGADGKFWRPGQEGAPAHTLPASSSAAP